MSTDLQILRTAKTALDEGLIDLADFDIVKSSFLKAQSIKAGLDAGFIGETDYAEARREFFSSLGMANFGTPTPRSTAGELTMLPPPAPASARHCSQPVTAPSTAPSRAIAQDAAANSRVSTAAAPCPPLAIEKVIGSDLHKSSDDLGSLAVTPASSRAASTPVGASNGLLRFEDRGGVAAVADKRSMAGIGVHPDAVNICWELRVRKKYRWVSFKIASAGKVVEIDRIGEPGSTYGDFAASMPPNSCRYGVYDYEYINSEGTAFGKLVFLSWAPDAAPTKAKMQHASTKDFFRGFIDGLSVDLHVTDAEDLNEAALREQVANTVARK